MPAPPHRLVFFAILGESQANLRDEQRNEAGAADAPPEYGVITQVRPCDGSSRR